MSATSDSSAAPIAIQSPGPTPGFSLNSPVPSEHSVSGPVEFRRCGTGHRLEIRRSGRLTIATGRSAIGARAPR